MLYGDCGEPGHYNATEKDAKSLRDVGESNLPSNISPSLAFCCKDIPKEATGTYLQ